MIINAITENAVTHVIFTLLLDKKTERTYVEQDTVTKVGYVELFGIKLKINGEYKLVIPVNNIPAGISTILKTRSKQQSFYVTN